MNNVARWSLVAGLLLSVGCGPETRNGGDDDPAGDGADLDGDGYKGSVDCNDSLPAVFPGATETCNGVDDNCDGIKDEPFDLDKDGFPTCFGDCADDDNSRYPGATEIKNGIDEDCDGAVDDNLLEVDDDGDGYSELDGDCDDSQPLVNPGSVEVKTKEDGTAEGVDNDCNGMVDEDPAPCDMGIPANSADAMDYAKAMGLCKNVVSATWKVAAGDPGHKVPAAFGTLMPREGQRMASLASGSAMAPADTQTTLNALSTYSHPSPQGDPGDGCGQADAAQVYDQMELELTIKVPSNAKSFSYDFNFMSAEWPEWVCKAYDDTFLALLTSQAYNGNISFDAMGRPVTVNVGFFTVCAVGSEPAQKPAGSCTGDAELSGTGYGNGVGGGTGWLTTTSPIMPGETIKLRFVIFDEGDRAFDSGVVIDNFRWLGTPVDGPVTEG